MSTSQRKPTAKSKKNRKSSRTFGKWISGLMIGMLGIIVFTLSVYFIILWNGSRLLKLEIDKFITSETTLVYDANQKEIAKLFRENGNRESVSSEEIPILMKQAIIAVEDQRFESHSGVDFWSIGRAIFTDITRMRLAEGGSTITQQLAKNVFLSAEKTFFRKATEMSVALTLETQYSKEEILEKYLNRIFFGHRAYGVKAASKVYFNQPDLNKLELWQIATLAASPKAPSTYSPISNPEKSKERRALVLRLMMEQGYINEQQRAEAEAVEYIAPKQLPTIKYASYVDYVLYEAESRYGISEDELLTKGYRIYTSMDTKVQTAMEQTYSNPKFFQKDAKDGKKIQSAMVVLDHQNGKILGLMGGRDYISKSYNRVFSLRQPGSVIKPIIVYAPAIESGNWNPYSMLSNQKQVFGNGKQTYEPQNYDQVYSENVPMYEAVKKSMNIPAVWLLNEIGIKNGIAFSNKLGLDLGANDRHLAAALGGLSKGVSPLQMASAYGAIANQGMQYSPYVITKILDSHNQTVAEYTPKRERVMSATTAYYIRLLLEKVVEPGGTGDKAYFQRPLAGKTGSTGLTIKGIEKYDRDVWFVGFTPEWTAAVWQGFDQTDSQHYVTVGSGSTAVIFKEVMSKALKGKSVTPFVVPKDAIPLNPPVPIVSDFNVSIDEENQRIQLKWTSLGEKFSYEIYRKTLTDQEFVLWTETTASELTDEIVPSSEKLQYYIVAKNPETQNKGEASPVVEINLKQIPNEGANGEEITSVPSSSPEATSQDSNLPNESPTQ
jgi:penicillin-binding protein 2A